MIDDNGEHDAELKHLAVQFLHPGLRSIRFADGDNKLQAILYFTKDGTLHADSWMKTAEKIDPSPNGDGPSPDDIMGRKDNE